MSRPLSIFFLFFAFSLNAANVFYSTFEFGLGYKADGLYAARGTGVYVTIPRTRAQSQGWDISYSGSETVISGVKNPNLAPPPPYTAMIYRGGFVVDDTYATNSSPLVDGVPYSGGTAPVGSTSDGHGFNLNGNQVVQGPVFDNFGDLSQYPELQDNSMFVAYDQEGVPRVYSLTQNDGQYYLSSNADSLAVPISDPSAIPVRYMDNGQLVNGYYNSSDGQFSPSPENGSGGSSSVDVTSVVNAVNAQGAAIVSSLGNNDTNLRNYLINVLGASGASWVYDCKLSTEQLLLLARQGGIGVELNSTVMTYLNQLVTDSGSQISYLNAIAEKDFSPTINVAAPNVNVDTSSLAKETTLGRVKTSLDSVHNDLYNYLRPNVVTMRQILESWNTGNDLPTLPQPDFGNEQPNDNLPAFAQSAWASDGVLSDSSLAQTYGDMVSWGDNGSPTMVVPDFVSSFLTTWIGSIPSVGSDPVMFDVEFDLPYVGRVSKRFSWADYPYVSDFRALLVWLAYVFFGLACFKLLHKTFI